MLRLISIVNDLLHMYSTTIFRPRSLILRLQLRHIALFLLSSLPRVSSPLPVFRASLRSTPYTPRIDCTLLFSVTLYYSYPSHSCMTTVSISSHYFLYILLCIYVLYDNVTQFRLCSKEGAVAFDAVYFK